MASIREEETRSPRNRSLAERLRKLEKKATLKTRTSETAKTSRPFKFPFKWKLKFSQSRRSRDDSMLVFFLNKKNEIEPPKFMPIFDGNMIVWKNKPYEFDPRAVWTVKGVRRNPKAYLIKEIDRRPVRNKFGRGVYVDAAVSNMDLDEVRARGDSTESDEFLIKAALKAQTSQAKKQASMAVIVILILGAVGAGIYFLTGAGS